MLSSTISTILPSPTVNLDKASNLTSGLTSILACIIPVLAFLYFGAIILTWDYSRRREVAIEKRASSASMISRFRRVSAPVAYAFTVIISLIVIAFSSWLLLRYSLFNNYPSPKVQIALRLVSFSASWTFVTSALLTILVLHPSWCKYALCSLGAQTLWACITCVLWLASVLVFNRATPIAVIFRAEVCAGIVYCQHLQTVLVLAVLQMSGFAIGVTYLGWRSWQCAQRVRQSSVQPV
ncbi:unnamed protein product [Mycena citricolor]|uniref:MARVEL domain-containing protein n=1 Tax=Mycena citricolor TaxID=2018698 RepID=A0AAD2H3R8_9AGAR|nr:unnamed protein product [Mycena citricolor]